MKIRFEKFRLRRRWWQYLLRLGTAGALTLAAVVVTVPWWLPRGYVARQVEKNLSAELGVPVHVGDLSIGWGQGIVLHDFTVANPPTFGAEPLLTAPLVRVSLNPFSLLISKRLDWVVVEHPALRIVTDHQGRVNLLKLGHPKMDIEADRTSIRGATVTMLAADGQMFHLSAADAQIDSPKFNPAGRLTLTARLDQPGAAGTIFADIIGNDDDALVELGFYNVDLAHFSPAEPNQSPLKRLAGNAQGRLKLPVHQGTIRGGRLEIEVANLDVQPASGIKLPALPKAHLYVEGDADLAAQVVDLRHLTVAAPGVELAGAAQLTSALLQGSLFGAHNVHLAGRIEPQVLAALMNHLAADGRAADVISGPVSIDLTYGDQDQAIQARLMIDATDATVALNHQSVKPAGEILQCLVQANCQPKTWKFGVDQAELRWAKTASSRPARWRTSAAWPRSGKAASMNGLSRMSTLTSSSSLGRARWNWLTWPPSAIFIPCCGEGFPPCGWRARSWVPGVSARKAPVVFRPAWLPRRTAIFASIPAWALLGISLWKPTWKPN